MDKKERLELIRRVLRIRKKNGKYRAEADTERNKRKTQKQA